MARRKRSSSTVKNFSSKGSSSTFSQGSGRLAQVGHFDPSTGTIYAPRRISLDQGISSGGRVRVTQPRALPAAQARRTPSIGMGGVLSEQQYN